MALIRRGNTRKSRGRALPGRRGWAAAAGQLEALESRNLLAATVMTDQLDYAPNSTALITTGSDGQPGRDFLVGEVVDFHIVRADGAPNNHPAHSPWRVTDGVGGFTPWVDSHGVAWRPDLDGQADGRILTDWFVAPHFLGASLQLTATGLTSQASATTFFTDNALVNTTTTGSQAVVAATPRNVAFDAQGNYVVVWSGNGAQTGQVDDVGIFAQRFNASGVKVGGEVRVNTTTTNSQANPVISMADNGDFVVVWATLAASSNWDIAARRFTVDAAGQIVAKSTGGSTNQFVVAAPSGVQGTPTVAMENDGGFVVAWRNNAGNRIDQRRYDAAGTGATTLTVVSLATAVNPSTAIADDLRSVVVWYEPTGIYGQLYGTTGAAVGAKFTIATTNVQLATTNYPQVAMDATGNFAVLWRHSNLNQYMFQRFNASGVAQGAATEVMANAGVAVTNASLSMNGAGSFVVSWMESSAARPVKLRQFSASGVATRSETVIDNATYATDKPTSVALDDAGRIVAGWSGSGPGDVDGVYALFYPTNVTPAPAVTAVSPLAGCSAGGSSVVITGTGFTGATAVQFGAVNATSFTVNSATQITAVAPAGAAGSVDVRVTTPAGTSANVAGDNFTYAASSIASVAVGAQSESVVYGTGKIVTYGVTATRAADCSIVNASYAVSGLPAGVTWTLTPTSVSSSGSTAIPGTTVSLTVPATLAAGSYPFTVTLTNGSEVVSGGGSLVVSGKSLVITANDRSKVYGSADSFVGTEFTAAGLINGDTITSVSLGSAGAAATAGVSTYAIMPSAAVGSGLANYSITYTSGSLTVTAKALVVSATDLSKTYGNTLAASGANFTTLGLVNGDTVVSVALGSTGAAATANVGTYPLVPSAASGNGLANYTITYTNATLSVTARPLVVSAANDAKIYGDAHVFAGTEFTATGLVNTDAVTSVSLSSSGVAATTPVGSYAITATAAQGSGLGNYSIIYANGSLTVSARSLVVTASNRAKTYGTAVSFAGTEFTASGLVNGDTVSSVSLASSGAAATSAVGAYAIVPSAATGTGLANYAISYTSGNLTVVAKALTVTASNRSKVYGNVVTFAGTEFTATGLVNSDTVGSVTLASTGTAATAVVGAYAIVPSAATGTGLANYSISYTNGSLAVTTRALVVAANDGSKTYGDVASFAGTEFTASGLVNSDAVTSVTLASSGATTTATVGSYPITPSAAVGSGLGNYSITYTAGQLTVGVRPLSIVAADRTKTYGTAISFSGTEFTTVGLVNSDAVASVGMASAGASSAASVGSYEITLSAAAGTGLANYSITYSVGTLTVDPKALLLTANNRSRTYGAASSFAGTEFTASGLVNSDAVSAVSLASDGTSVTAPVGTYPIVASQAVGTGLSNYTISYATGSLTVSAKPLTITASDQSKTQGAPFTFAGTEFTASGLVNSDTVDSVTLTSSATATTAAAGTYAIVPGVAVGAGLGNYAIQYTNGTFTVNPPGAIPDIVVTSATTTGPNTMRVIYQVNTAVAPAFVLAVARSNDDLYDAADTTIFSTTLTDAADLSLGSHAKLFTIGASSGQMTLPGVGVAETDEDYSLLVVADPADLINEGDLDPVNSDNTVRFSGVYAAPTGSVFVHGTSGADSITVATNRVTIGAVNHAMDSATTTAMRFRTGGGNDIVLAGSFQNMFRGGAGADSLTGGNLTDVFYGDADNDTLRGAGGDDVYYFDADLALGSDTIQDTTGVELIDYSATTGQGVSLSLGVITAQVVNTNHTLTLTSTSAIENIIGTSRADTITGNAAGNVIQGLGGGDTLAGAGGDDLYLVDSDIPQGSMVINDASGVDTIDFSATSGFGHLLDISLTTLQVVNANLTITMPVVGIENLVGGSLADNFTGNTFANRLCGNGGNDTLTGGAGNDTFVFDPDVPLGADIVADASGIDTLDFSASDTGVVVNLATNATQQILNANLRLTFPTGTTIENILGSNAADTLTGNAVVNVLEGRGGNDTLSGAAGNDSFVFDADTPLGSDTITDSGGTDSIDLSATTTQAVTLNLGLTTAQVINANLTLTLASATAIENAQGGSLADTLTGNSANNTLTGNAGDDTIYGGAGVDSLNGLDGNDLLLGEAGNDSLNGGNGNDTLDGGSGNDLLTGSVGDDTYRLNGSDSVPAAAQTKTLSDTGGSDCLDFSSTLVRNVAINLGLATVQTVNANLRVNLGSATAFEHVIGTQQADTITGNTLANILVGLGGNDVISGLGLRDLIIGGAGADTLTGGDDEDLLIAGTTSYDVIAASLASIHAKWTSALTYAQRIADLRSGTGSPALTAGTTVLTDGASADSLTGSLAVDWYFAALAEVTDKAADETVDVI